MEEEILKLIYDYYKSNKNIDKNLIEKIVEATVEHKNISSYVNNIYINDAPMKLMGNTFRLAYYDLFSKDITINWRFIEAFLDNCRKKYSPLFEKSELPFFENATVIQPIFHELEHATQNKNYNLDSNDIEGQLIKMVFSEKYNFEDPEQAFFKYLERGMSERDIIVLMENKRKLYKKYYEYNPVERLAEIRSYEMVANVFISMKDKVPNVYNFEYMNYVKKLLLGYKYHDNLVFSPTVAYINAIANEDKLEHGELYEQMLNKISLLELKEQSLISRLSLGLPVSNEEHNKVKRVLSLHRKTI